MSLKRLIQQNHNVHCLGYSVSPTYIPCLEPIGSPLLDNRKPQIFTSSMGTLPRDYKQLALHRTSSLSDSSGPQRKSLKLFKEDNEAYGFEIQTLRFQQQTNSCLESCTYVCKVEEGSPAHLSGLESGYILTNINKVSTEGLSHKQIVDLIRSSRNLLRLDIVNEALVMKRKELETKLCLLKKTLQDKQVEFQSLCLREQDLLPDEMNGTSPLDPVGLEESNLLSDYTGSGTPLGNKPRFPSESSCISRLSSMTVDSEDSFYQGGAFEDAGSFSRQSSTEDDCFFQRDSTLAVVKTSLRRHRSISVASSGSGSPVWDRGNATNIFGTLPRKSRIGTGSIRKRLLKFIPGLQRPVEEEESHV